mmetsp:Transcript_24254/g.95497  ORF Transcript_24254/g.95497 Transcript_24254/m.95497 type:complete len:164 (+) Transcript_24254:307-798(+)
MSSRFQEDRLACCVDSTELLHELQAYEDLHLKEMAKTTQSSKTKFNYAWALVRSSNLQQIKRGTLMLHGLLEDDYDEESCLFYIAVGYMRQNNPEGSKHYLQRLLEAFPDSRHALSFMDILDDSIQKKGSYGIGTVVTLASALATLSLAYTYYIKGYQILSIE